jgi:hypothetical protein
MFALFVASQNAGSMQWALIARDVVLCSCFVVPRGESVGTQPPIANSVYTHLRNSVLQVSLQFC